MSELGWGDGSPPGSSGPFFAGRSGSLPAIGNYDSYFCGVAGGYTTAAFTYDWEPVGADPNPVVWEGEAYGAYGLTVAPDSSGTLTISAVVDGVPASNQLKLVLVASGTYGYSYGSVAWAPTSFTPVKKSIGWGTAGGVNNTPTGSGYNEFNTGAAGAFGQDAVCGVVGGYGTVAYTHEWVPAVPGEPTAVSSALTSYGAYSVSISRDRAAGTVRVTAVIDGIEAATVCVLTVAFSNWVENPSTYGGFAWAAEGADSAGFWTLFIGTEEA